MMGDCAGESDNNPVDGGEIYTVGGWPSFILPDLVYMKLNNLNIHISLSKIFAVPDHPVS